MDWPAIDALLCDAMLATHAGEMPPAVLSALAAAARAVVHLRDASDISERLDRLEGTTRVGDRA